VIFPGGEEAGQGAFVHLSDGWSAYVSDYIVIDISYDSTRASIRDMD
jgi:hypothetical protein